MDARVSKIGSFQDNFVILTSVYLDLISKDLEYSSSLVSCVYSEPKLMSQTLDLN